LIGKPPLTPHEGGEQKSRAQNIIKSNRLKHTTQQNKKELLKPSAAAERFGGAAKLCGVFLTYHKT